MKPGRMALVLAAALALPAPAQWREFLTRGEIAQIREAQEPNKRLKLYVEFVRQRLAAVEKELVTKDAQRARRIHNSLWEYDRILDAIESNVEQAVDKRERVRKRLEQVLKAEAEFLKLLESFRARNPRDLSEYRFILDQTIDTTQSSLQWLRQAQEKLPKGKKEKRKRAKESRKD